MQLPHIPRPQLARLFGWLFVCGIFAAGILPAQQPVHFVIGGDDLANVEVYSLHQGADEILYAATDHGLYVYKHGAFQQIPAPASQQGSSLFNLKRDKKGRLFCNNLTGQVFILDQDSLKLYYQAEPEWVGSQFSCGFDAANDLIIASRSLVRVTGDDLSTHIIVGPSHESAYFSLFDLPNGDLAGLYATHDSVWLAPAGGGQARKYQIQFPQGSLPLNWQPVLLGESLFAMNVTGEIGPIIGAAPRQNYPTKIRERIFQIDNRELFALDFSKGGRILGLENGAMVPRESLFNDHFISTMTQGNRGLLFFGTFGEGVFVVPNRNATRINTDMVSGQLRGIAAGRNGEVFVTTRSGELFRYRDQMELVSKQTGFPLGRIYFFPGMDLGIEPAHPELLFEAKISIGSVKNASSQGDSAVIISTSAGVVRMGPEVVEPSIWTNQAPGQQKLKLFKERCYAAVYNQAGDRLYVATANQLNAVDLDGNQHEITFHGLSLGCNDLVRDGNRLLVATQKHGLLIFEADSLVKQYDRQSGLEDDFVAKMILEGRKLYLAHQQGVQVIDLEREEIKSFGMAEGIPRGTVRDMALGQDRLWLLVDDALLSIGLGTQSGLGSPLELVVDSVVVSGQKQKVDQGASGLDRFSYQENQVEFHVDFRIIELLDEAKFLYQLEGFDDDWQSVPARQSTIAYKSLPPGDYKFSLKVAWRDQESPTYTYALAISLPYWRTWWFFLLSALFLSLLVGAGFGYRIRQIRKANRERMQRQEMEKNLVESKLKALRSQMNPHFIFNSLNSIQDLILQQDTDRAYDYVVLFAELVRNTLRYSEQDFITIGDELDFLKTYLSLEELRFKDSFTYDISYHGSEDIEIPSMIVQPFIENALQHGLLHKVGQKRLDVNFELGEFLVCTITDNGVGRELAKKIKERQGGRHDSFSLDAIRQRIDILEGQGTSKAGFEIEDLYQEEQAAGTRVTIRLSYRRLF